LCFSLAEKYPLKIIKEPLQKYTKEDGEKEKYHVAKKEEFKYIIEKD